MMLRKRRQRKTGRSWTDGHAPPPWSPGLKSYVSGRCNGVGADASPSSARGGGENGSGDAGPWGAEGERGRWSPELGGFLQ